MDGAIATQIAAGFDEQMAGCILDLYRCERQSVMADLGLILIPTEDHLVGTEVQRNRSAARSGARVAVRPGLGHWWMTEDERRSGAAALTSFWSQI